MRIKLFLLNFFFLCISTIATSQFRTPEFVLDSLHLTLPQPNKAIANYVSVVQSGKLLFVSGAIPRGENEDKFKGKLGGNISIELGYLGAQTSALQHLALLKSYLGDLTKIKRVVKVLGMVNATPEFDQHPKVINGYSDFMVQIFGEKGRHARSAVGVSSLPFNLCVEVEAIFEIE